MNEIPIKAYSTAEMYRDQAPFKKDDAYVGKPFYESEQQRVLIELLESQSERDYHGIDVHRHDEEQNGYENERHEIYRDETARHASRPLSGKAGHGKDRRVVEHEQETR